MGTRYHAHETPDGWVVALNAIDTDNEATILTEKGARDWAARLNARDDTLERRVNQAREALGDLASVCPPHIMDRYREIRRKRRGSDPSKRGLSQHAGTEAVGLPNPKPTGGES
jgi:hypothetical protein